MGIDLDLWEQAKPPQKKIVGVGYSTIYLSNEDKRTLSYKMWRDMIRKCYGIGEQYKNWRRGKRLECCNSWLDYQKFAKWFQGNYKECQRNDMVLTRCVISKDNTIYNPNNCAIVPREIYTYLELSDWNMEKARVLAEKYKNCITEEIYEILTEEY